MAKGRRKLLRRGGSFFIDLTHLKSLIADLNSLRNMAQLSIKQGSGRSIPARGNRPADLSVAMSAPAVTRARTTATAGFDAEARGAVPLQ